jgi:hypothetical protein
VTALANWTRTEIKPCLVAYTWRGWALDEWPRDGVNVLWHDTRPVMEFGPIEHLVKRAVELEAEHDVP